MSENKNTNTTPNTPAINTKDISAKAKELAVKAKDVAVKHVNGAKAWAKAHPKHATAFGVVLGALLLWKMKGKKGNKGSTNSK